jgi:hypothetical protein
LVRILELVRPRADVVIQSPWFDWKRSREKATGTGVSSVTETVPETELETPSESPAGPDPVSESESDPVSGPESVSESDREGRRSPWFGPVR